MNLNELRDFTGGVNNVVAPHNLAPNEASVLVNADLTKGSLKSVAKPLTVQSLSHPYWFEFAGKVQQYDLFRSNVIWNNTWYWADGIETKKMYPDGTEVPLGLPTPTVVPVIESIDDGNLVGSVRYCYTFYSRAHGTESAPSPMTDYIDAKGIELSDFEELPDGADSYRLYRIGGYLPYFQLVDTIEGDYTDIKDENSIDGRLLRTIRNGVPPYGLKYLVEFNGRLFGAVGNRLYWSALGNPDSWYVFDYILLKDQISGIAKTQSGLLVMGYTWTNMLVGTTPMNFRLVSVSDKVGCRDFSSIAYMDGYALWLSSHGIVRSAGTGIDFITKNKIETISNINPISAVVSNHIYYLAYGPSLFPGNELYPNEELYPAGIKGTVDKGLIILDFKRGNGYSYHVRSLNTIGYISIYKGEIAATIDKELKYLQKRAFTLNRYFTPSAYKHPGVRLFPTTLISVEHEIASNSEELYYLSPVLIDNSYATLKEYDKVRILFNGSFKIDVLFDNDRIIQSQQIESLDRNGFALIGIPNSDNKAYSIRFSIKGSGSIHSIQYTYKNRELP